MQQQAVQGQAVSLAIPVSSKVSGRVARSHTRLRKEESCGRPYDRVEAPGRLSQQEAEEVRRIVGEQR